jgi:Tfp pilus assembly protein PilO
VAFVVLVILAVAFLVLPKNSEVGEKRQDLQEAEEQEAVLQSELARLQALEEDLPRIRRQLAGFRRAVPAVADLPGLINQLQSAADVAGVDFFAITPAEPLPAVGGQATQIPARIQVIGGFFPVDELLFRLETLRRAAKVVSITITEGPDGAPQINVELEVRFFTTDLDAGPGAPVETEVPDAGPSPSPSPSPTPTDLTSPGA